MPRYLAATLSVLFVFASPFLMPAAPALSQAEGSAQESGSRGLLDTIDTLKSAVRIEANEIERRERDKLTIARGDVRILMENRILNADEVEADEAQQVIRARGGCNSSMGKAVWTAIVSNTTIAPIRVSCIRPGRDPARHHLSRDRGPQGG
ncbi:MAG: hypothetical protein M5R38_13465 [Candidatus Methylomirabilis sp.]|nr:hypothetical protein [Candidatus Methylomirabilis sp.]